MPQLLPGALHKEEFKNKEALKRFPGRVKILLKKNLDLMSYYLIFGCGCRG